MQTRFKYHILVTILLSKITR